LPQKEQYKVFSLDAPFFSAMCAAFLQVFCQ